MPEKSYKCKMCGKCCYQDIPLSLCDIHRIALGLGIPDAQVFDKSVSHSIASRINTFIIKKQENGACIYLDDKNRCSIHPFRPRTCSFYPCPEIYKSDKELWRELYLSSAPYEVFWESSMAQNHTEIYIQNFGTTWNEEGYFKILHDLKKYIIVKDGEKIAVARQEDGTPIALKYNCRNCRITRCPVETEITLKDIERISNKRGITLSEAFKTSVSKDPTSPQGGLKLKKTSDNSHCIYCSAKDIRSCTIYDFRPAYCKLAPCRTKIASRQMWVNFFYAGGTLTEQWEFEVSTAITRAYVREMGTKYNRAGFRQFMRKIDVTIKNRELKEQFIQGILPHRFDVIPIEPLT